MKQRVLLSMGVGACLLGAGLGLTGTAVSQPTPTQDFVLSAGEGWPTYAFGFVPGEGRRGDVLMFRGPLTSEGQNVGTGFQNCRIVKKTSSATTTECDGTADLQDGSLQIGGLFLFGAPPDVPTAQTLAVTGGTGAYEGATGTVTIEEIATEEEFRIDWAFSIVLP